MPGGRMMDLRKVLLYVFLSIYSNRSADSNTINETSAHESEHGKSSL